MGDNKIYWLHLTGGEVVELWQHLDYTRLHALMDGVGVLPEDYSDNLSNALNKVSALRDIVMAKANVSEAVEHYKAVTGYASIKSDV